MWKKLCKFIMMLVLESLTLNQVDQCISFRFIDGGRGKSAFFMGSCSSTACPWPGRRHDRGAAAAIRAACHSTTKQRIWKTARCSAKRGKSWLNIKQVLTKSLLRPMGQRLWTQKYLMTWTHLMTCSLHRWNNEWKLLYPFFFFLNANHHSDASTPIWFWIWQCSGERGESSQWQLEGDDLVATLPSFYFFTSGSRQLLKVQDAARRVWLGLWGWGVGGSWRRDDEKGLGQVKAVAICFHWPSFVTRFETKEKEIGQMPLCGYKKIEGKLVTKHDKEITQRENAKRFKTWHNFFAINNFCLESWNSLLESTLAMVVVLTCRSQTRCIFVILQIATILGGEQAYIASGVLTWIQCKSGKQYLWNKLLVSALPVATKHPELSRDLSWKEYS